MLSTLSFYIFSALLSYTDCTKYKIPNITLVALSVFLIIFGIIEDKFNYYSLLLAFTILIFFVIILIIIPKIILGGGDIKYIMVVAIYLQPIMFPIFLVITGILQTLFLIYFQKIKNRRVAPMAPAIFLAVIFVDIIEKLNIYPF